jgi:hypothetical protein
MNRTQLEHIIRAASQISGDSEIVVIGSQAIHAQSMKLPPIAFQSDEADVYPRNHPERADAIDAAIGELSPFHDTHGYYRHGVGPTTAILPEGWERRVVRLSNANTGGATGLCIDAHDLVLSKYAAGAMCAPSRHRYPSGLYRRVHSKVRAGLFCPGKAAVLARDGERTPCRSSPIPARAGLPGRCLTLHGDLRARHEMGVACRVLRAQSTSRRR